MSSRVVETLLMSRLVVSFHLILLWQLAFHHLAHHLVNLTAVILKLHLVNIILLSKSVFSCCKTSL